MRKKRLPFLICAILVVALCSHLSYIFINQDNLLFKNNQVDLNVPYESSHLFEELFFDTYDAGRLHAIHFKCKHPKGVVVYFHGRGGNLFEHFKKLPDEFLKRSYNVLALDYRNFGKSRGKLSEKALLEDAKLLYEYAKKTFSPQQIILYGHSLGTGIATYVASIYPSKHLILEAPYFSMYDLACDKYAFIPKKIMGFFLKYQLKTNEWIQKSLSPIAIFHGEKDDLIPHTSSHRLYHLIKQSHKAALYIIKEAGHNNLPKFETYQKTLSKILDD